MSTPVDVLVAGGGGFIGGHLVNHLLEQGHSVRSVDVKPLSDLSPREIEHDNPEIRRVDEFVDWLSKLYNRPVSTDDTITVIRFSQIVGTMF